MSSVTLTVPTTDTLHTRQESRKPPGIEMVKHKAFQSQNFNEEIKTLYTEKTHKAVVNTLKK